MIYTSLTVSKHAQVRVLPTPFNCLNLSTTNFPTASSDLPPSAGFGIGIERLTRFIYGLKNIEEASLFPKVPGKECI